MSNETDQVYHSFLVRCWLIPPVTSNEPPAWRFELREVPAETQKHRFRDLGQLKEYMSAKLVALTPIRNREGGKEESLKGGKPYRRNEM